MEGDAADERNRLRETFAERTVTTLLDVLRCLSDLPRAVPCRWRDGAASAGRTLEAVPATSDGREHRFRVGVLSEDGGRRVFVIDAPAALTAALTAFHRISLSPAAVIDVWAVREVGRTRVTIEAACGSRYRLSVKVVET